MAPSRTIYECGSCGHEVSGYKKTELQGFGWVWHAHEFVMCDECEDRYAKRRQAKDAE